MKKISKYVILIFMLMCSFTLVRNETVEAKNIVAKDSYSDFSDQTVWSIEIFDNGVVELNYRYGLRKVDVYYCKKGDQCNIDFYTHKSIMESNSEDTYKRDGTELIKYDFVIPVEENGEYRIRVEAYFGKSSAYTGLEPLNGGSFTITQKQIVDTNDKYVYASSNGIVDPGMSALTEDIESIVNGAVLPIIYVVTSAFLVIKGSILGVQIVKSADDSSVRSEKIGALKWLVIGVGITYAATTIVGLLTGFFKTAF